MEIKCACDNPNCSILLNFDSDNGLWMSDEVGTWHFMYMDAATWGRLQDIAFQRMLSVISETYK